MALEGILLYCMRAGSFALAVCATYVLACLLRRRRPGLRRLVTIAYIAALVQITVLRGGVDWTRVAEGGRSMPQLIPFRTTLRLLQESSTWNFVYNTLGNLLWFVPLGVLIGGGRPGKALLLGAGLSASIELSQFLLMTGLTDVDDVIINALGSLLGCFVCGLWQKKRRPCEGNGK